MSSLTARANTGAGTDLLAGEVHADGFAGAVILRDAAGNPVEPLTDAQLRASALPLPAGAASEATLTALNDKVANTPSGALLIGTASDRFFDNFADFDTVNTWEVVQTGTGMAITGTAWWCSGGVIALSADF